jgi:D-amino-acid dehydrogenase
MRVLIIGAGILGASTAWHLVRAGAEVVVIDAAHDGRATQAGAGIINPWSSGREDEAWYAMAAGGARTTPGIVAALAEEGETDTGYARVGAICVSADPTVLDEAEQRTRARAGNDPRAGEITRLTPAEARRLFPPLHPERAALHIAGAARLDGRRLTASLLAAARRVCWRRRAVPAAPSWMARRSARIAWWSPRAPGRRRCSRRWGSPCRCSRSAVRSRICGWRVWTPPPGRSCCR